MDEKELEKVPEYVREAQAEKLRAEAEAFRATAKRELEEARKQTSYADAAEIELDQKRKAVAELETDDKFHRVYYFSTEVTDRAVELCMDRLTTWHRLYPDQPITIVFTSPGGSVVSGMALWDFIQHIRDEGHQVTTKALGMAASMAGILLQVGDKRIMGKETYLLIHQVQAGMMGTFGDLQDRMKWLEKVQERILDIFATRASAATGKDFRAVRKMIAREWERTDWWIDSAEALRLGLVDEVE